MTRVAETTTGGGAARAHDCGGGRMAGGERRQQILGVAMRLFSQHGFRGTTTKEIARDAGVSEAMVFRHFATKQELYSAILDFKACSGTLGDPREFLADALRRKDDRAVFTELALALMHHHESDQEFLRLLTHAALEEHELAQMFWERTIRQMYEFLGGYVRERQRDGAFRQVEPAVVVRSFLGTIIHHSLNNTLWDKRRTLLDITNERAATEFTEILLRGVEAHAGDVKLEKQKRAPAATPATARKKKKRSAGGDK
jgi:AcrR family transcriptional regulator